jgi:hypothetical protein
MGGAGLGAAQSQFAVRKIAGFIFLLAGFNAKAACICRCVDGEMQPLCETTLEIPPACPPAICNIPPPAVRPIPAPAVPPIGTGECLPRQVQNPVTGTYEWRTLCR